MILLKSEDSMSRSKFYPVNDVLLTDILLDTSNARIRVGIDQNDCISRILRKEAQLLNLMKDIAENGLSTIPILVSPSECGKKWVVKDGNRRITVLKLLSDPDSCPVNELKPKIRSIREQFIKNVVDKVDVLCSNDEDEIVREVIRRHSGAMGGVGQLDWNAYLRTIYLIEHYKNSEYKRAGQYLLWCEKADVYVDEEFPISTLSRFFSEENLNKLGFSIDGDVLVENIAAVKIKRIASRIISDFNPPARLTVDAVRTPKDASDYIARIRLEVGVDSVEFENEEVNKKNEPEGTGGGHNQNNNMPPVPKDKEDDLKSNANLKRNDMAKPAGPSKPSWDRPKLFKSGKAGFNVPSDHIKVQNILSELKILNLAASANRKATPMAVAMLFRALIEMSVKHYQERNAIKIKDTLHSNIASAADHMREFGTLSVDQHSVIIQRSRDEAGMLHVRTLQAYVHSEAFHPNQQVLNTLWDEVGPFVMACWK